MNVQLMTSKVHEDPDMLGIIKTLRERLLSHVNDAEALCRLGQAYADRGDLERGLTFLYQAVAADQKNPMHFSSLGDILRKKGRYLEAICAFRQALTLDNTLAATYDGLGMVQSLLGEYDLATASMRVATQKSPQNPEFWANLATNLLQQHKYAEAKEAAMRAYTLDKKLRKVCANLAESEFGQAQFDAGLRWLRQALRQNPNSPGILGNIARGYMAKNQWRQAVTYFRREISGFPKNKEAQFGVAQSLLAMGNFSEGWDRYEWRLKKASSANSRAGRFINDLTEPMWAGEDLGRIPPKIASQ
jgi:tetratricopeptide (TPR) repeat protein